MSSIFQKSVSSAKIAKKVSGLQVDIAKVETLLSAKESEIEAAIGNGGNSDRLFTEAGQLRGKKSAMNSILEKLQVEFTSAQDRENRAERLDELNRFEKFVKRNIEELTGTLSAAVSTAVSLSKKEVSFGEQCQKLIHTLPPAGVHGGGLPAVNLRGLSTAVSSKTLLDGDVSAAAISTAEAEVLSNLQSVQDVFLSRISAARSELSEDAE